MEEHKEKINNKGNTVKKVATLKELVDGSFLSKDKVVDQLPLILFLSFLGVLYIANGYHAQSIYRKTLQLQQEVTDLRAESITVSSRLMSVSRQSEVLKLLNEKGIGLVESVQPPKKLNNW